ncbi:uncharacterized protein LOC126634092 isoform X2 [Malus sylvestris]|uniref:uncharacterized protein LOC126634092 isoform X2 n=1 Tax=Malus sylvestris TaxID=3752 RepID=UPI0021AC3CED|nr:uncharacterized protein LOC126634092 isoform X2 [Malus sylvestris]
MADALPSSSTLSLLTLPSLPPQNPTRPLQHSCFIATARKRDLVRCKAKKKISLADQILDYIEEGEELRDAVLVTDGDSEMGQMVILSLIVKRARIKALVKDKRVALEAFGTYVESMARDSKDKPFLKRVLRGVSTVICPNEGFLSTVGSLKGVKHIILLSQLSVYKGANGIQAFMKSNARKLAEQDESIMVASGIPYTVIRAGSLQNSPGGTQGFSFEQGSAAKGTLSKEDAAFICAEAVGVVPQRGFIFEVVNGDEKVSDWKEFLNAMLKKSEEQPQ